MSVTVSLQFRRFAQRGGDKPFVMRRTHSPVNAWPDIGDQQRLVNERFQSHAVRWDELYDRDDLFSIIHRHRHQRALRWIDQLGLAAGSPVLEIGPGAGLMTAALARRGYLVTAADSTPTMIEIARRRARHTVLADGSGPAGLPGAQTSLLLGDAHKIPLRDESVALVVALGVVPWLHSPVAAVAEMARVLRPGGYLVLNADNRRRLSLLLDPWHTPALDPARRMTKRALAAAGLRADAGQHPAVTAHSRAEFDAILTRAGLEPLQSCTYGFGPFTMLRSPVLPERLGVPLHLRLQRFADHGTPVLRCAGGQYLVLARATK